MIANDLTVVIATKNRQKNISLCIPTILTNSIVPKVIVVDFGSSVPVSSYIKYDGINIVRVDRNTEPFHKSRALNIGLNRVGTKYVCVTDADQIFQNNFFETVQSWLLNIKKSFIMCGSYKLHSNDIIDVTTDNISAKYNDLLKVAKLKSRLFGDGCCHATNTDWFMSTRGYEESIVGWGFEDSDVAWRARVTGRHITRIHRHTSMIHLAHPKTGSYYKKDVVEKNKKLYWFKRVRKIKKANINSSWGLV